jgi:hypothetical protein
MNIQKWTGNSKKIMRTKKKMDKRGEERIMEMIKKELRETKFVKADTKNVLSAIKKCNKKYDKAMRNLAK